MMLEQVISGGQTGADQAALQAAEAVGLATGGWMPKGWKTENGPRPDLGVRFNMQEHHSDSYRARTLKNLAIAQATIIIYRGKLDGGSMLTERFCRLHRKECLLVPTLDATTLGVAAHWLIAHQVRVLNVAGNRESKAPELQAETAEWLRMLFLSVKDLDQSRNRPQEGQGAIK